MNEPVFAGPLSVDRVWHAQKLTSGPSITGAFATVKLTGMNEDRDVAAPVAIAAPQNRIFGTGEMADRTRAFDWSGTPVGAIEQWPDALLITVNTVLASRQPMFLWWGDDLIQFYNDAYRPSLGADKHPKALGQKGRECWPEIWPIVGSQIEAVMERGESSWNVDRLVPIYRNGRLEDVYWTYSYSPVRDSDGNVRATLVTTSETTGKVLAEQTLKRELERLADLFEQAPAFFAVLRGPEHVFEMTNSRYQELIGHRDVIGRPVRDAVPEAEEQGFFGLLDQVYQSGELFVGHGTRIDLARGAGHAVEERYLDFVYQPMRENGSVSGIIVLGVDVTEGRRAEQALIQAEKIAAVGRLASSIAHEINNPLEAVTNLLYLLENEPEPKQRQHYLAQAQEELARVATISTQTLRFHRQSTKAKKTSLREVLKSVLTLTAGRVKNARITVETRYETEQEIMAYEADLRQVFANLVSNALDASEQGGRIILAVRDSVGWVSGERGVRVSVVDTGSGMSEETRRRIFEPFFTTRSVSGTGLGLWVSAGILQNHRASVRVRSSQGPEHHGTIFSIFFPLDFQFGQKRAERRENEAEISASRQVA